MSLATQNEIISHFAALANARAIVEENLAILCHITLNAAKQKTAATLGVKNKRL
ncbi:MAG: hypothetical protein KDK05_04995 [Candidatus Competibacteraceae bacterium]|nr:hypothetical protein [Candidatus Competibacteraceae bacterium]MCB1809105.1 hypothetical protein [Candidatus Competibacteraceae bacterium]